MTPMTLATALIIFSGLTHAIVNAVLKSGKDKMTGRALIDGFSALLVAPAIFWVPLPGHAWHWLGLSWAVHILYLFCLIKSFETLDMSVAYPVARGLAPFLAATAAVLMFHEPATGMVMLGIVLISLGIFTVACSHRVDRRALGWPMATGVTIALYTVIDAQGVRAAPTAASYIAWTFLMLGAGIGSLFVLWRGWRNFYLSAADQWKPGLIAGALSIVTYGSALLAFRWGSTPRLAALRETSILFASVIAIVFLKERLSLPRIGGIALIAGGAMVLLTHG